MALQVEEARVALQVEEEEARVAAAAVPADEAVQRALWAPPLLLLLLPLATSPLMLFFAIGCAGSSCTMLPLPPPSPFRSFCLVASFIEINPVDQWIHSNFVVN